MSMSVFKGLVNRIATSTSSSKVHFTLHGGEPSLLPASWLEEAIGYGETVFSSQDKEAVFGMQSNALALSEAKLGLLKELGIRLSISLDGPPDLESLPRPLSERAVVKFLLAQEVGLAPSLLMTINHSNYGAFDKICVWAEQELGISRFKANLVSPVGRGANLPALPPEGAFIASRAILEHMVRTGGQGLVEDNIALELIRFFRGPERRGLCRQRTCGAGKSVIGVSPDGLLLPCGRVRWDDSNYYLGSLTTLPSAATQKQFCELGDQFHSLAPESWLDCDRCPANAVCSYGCQAFVAQSPSHLNVDCIPTQLRWEYYNTNRAALEEVARNLIERDALAVSKSIASRADFDYRDYMDYHDYQDYSDYGN